MPSTFSSAVPTWRNSSKIASWSSDAMDVGRRLADDAQDLGGRCLTLQRLTEAAAHGEHADGPALTHEGRGQPRSNPEAAYRLGVSRTAQVRRILRYHARDVP